MEQGKEYFAFISYKSEDVEWAIWLQHELEHYHLPTSFNGRADVRQELRPVFRDIDELSAGNLPEQIKQALVNSENLIVICSPQAAKSPWVNQEVETFISLGKVNQIFPFIVEGNSPKEFFPPSLLNLPKKEERLGGDVSKNGRDSAFVKVVAGMLGVGFDSLWNRYEKEKAEEERKIREQRDNLLRVQSRFLAEKANALVEEGDSYTARLLALEALPKDLESPDRPYVIEAEDALRKAIQSENFILKGHAGLIYYVAFSSDGKRIVSASWDKTIRIWDADTGRLISSQSETFFNWRNRVNWRNRIVKFSPDGKRLISVSSDTIRIWDADTGKQIGNPIVGHSKGINSAVFSPDGKRIVSASDDKTIRIWDANTGKQIGNPIEGHSAEVHSAVFSPDGERIISTSWRDKTIRIWDANTGKQIGNPIVENYYLGNCTCLCPDGKLMVSTSKGDIINICIIKTEQQIGESLEGHSKGVHSAVFSSDGKFIVSASSDSIRIWDAKTGEQIGNDLKGHMDFVLTVSFSTDGKRLVSGSSDKTIRIWDADTGKQIGNPIEGHSKGVNSAVFSPDGKRIVSASWDKSVKIWDFPPLQDIIDQTRKRFKYRQLASEERKKYYLD